MNIHKRTKVLDGQTATLGLTLVSSLELNEQDAFLRGSETSKAFLTLSEALASLVAEALKVRAAKGLS